MSLIKKEKGDLNFYLTNNPCQISAFANAVYILARVLSSMTALGTGLARVGLFEAKNACQGLARVWHGLCLGTKSTKESSLRVIGL